MRLIFEFNFMVCDSSMPRFSARHHMLLLIKKSSSRPFKANMITFARNYGQSFDCKIFPDLTKISTFFGTKAV